MIGNRMRRAARWETRWATFLGLIVAGLAGQAAGAKPDAGDDPLAAWRSGVTVRPVSETTGRHTIHAYFNTCPESPDGSRVVFYASTTREGQEGDVCVVDRATGRQQVVARGVTVEDAHRAACQQWISQGRRVAFHDVRNGLWLVAVVDLDTGKERVLVRDRQLCWGQPDGDLLPVYGCHWDPKEHRDLELVNAETGEVRTVVRAADVKKKYPDSIQRHCGDRVVSIFFPILSPDGKRVFFKISSPAGGDFRSKKASDRWGLVSYDLEQSRFLFIQGNWRHPAWLPDSRTIIQAGGVLTDADTGSSRRIPDLPKLSGSHPSVSPDGRLMVSDATLEGLGGAKGEWGIVVAPITGGDYVIVHRFDNSRGARSWRPSHPHPVFSPDGKRIYFNTNDTEWTRLLVAEAGGG